VPIFLVISTSCPLNFRSGMLQPTIPLEKA
jgi:hypothetical protein